MGGGLHFRALPARLLAAAVAWALLALITAASAAGHDRAAPLPTLVRVAAPQPVPAGIVTPVPPRAEPPKAETTTTTAPPPTTSTTAAPAAPPPPPGPEIPTGKGMWVYKPERSEGGNAVAMVIRAKQVGLTHIFVRTGSSWDGFQNATFLDWLLPLAHQNGIKVYGWDFPQLVDLNGDVNRAMTALNHVAPGGNRLDGFAADIETKSEGTEINGRVATAYGIMLRQHVGPSTLLIAVVPNPTAQKLTEYPYPAVVGSFDTIAPMIYWLNRDPGDDTANALHYLARFGKPLVPVGQAYDGGPEGGRPGVPPPAELLRFMEVAKQYGAVGVSFWSWQAANGPVWDTIRDAPFFKKPG